MEFYTIQWLTLLTVSVNIILGATAVTSSDWLSKSVRAASRGIETQNQVTRHSTDVADSDVVTGKSPNTCCYNGGLCIMNTFCHCKTNFYGRHCEHRVRHRSCGTIQHGTWMAAGCHLCHCFDGKIKCKTTNIRGCDKLSYIEGHEEDPDYMIGMDKKVEDYDLFYEEDYISVTENTSGSMQRAPATVSMIGVMSITMVLWNFVS